MKRAVIYARYSSDSQRASSIIDQQRRCQRHADEHNLNVVDIFADEAEKGWNRERPQYQAMLAAARRKEFEVLLVDDLSRPFRDSVEQNKTLQQFRILGIRTVSVADGWDSAAPGAKLTAGLKGLMNEQYSDALGLHTHRGQEGRIVAGFSAGGDIYGYFTEPIRDGSRTVGYRRLINETEAAVVREIYEHFADGLSPQAIADLLNDRGVAPPRGKSKKGQTPTWARNAIYGDQRDLSGILANPIYRGQVVWNRSTFLRDPESGTRKKVRKDEAEWVRNDMPELRVVSKELVARVEARLESSKAKGDAIREGLGKLAARSGADGKYMLTGLLHCATCGGPVSSTAKDTFGCSVRHNKGKHACANDLKFKRSAAEQAVLRSVQEELFTPAAIDRFLELLQDEQRKQHDTQFSDVKRLKASLVEVEDSIRGCLAFIEKGKGGEYAEARYAELVKQAFDIRAQLREVEAERPLVKADFDALKSFGLAALNDLPGLLAGAPAEVRAILSNLLGDSVVSPMPETKSLHIHLTGQVAGLIEVAASKQRKKVSTNENGPTQCVGPM